MKFITNNEVAFSSEDRAFEFVKLLMNEECYIPMVSREEDLYIVNWIFSDLCDRNDVIFLSKEEYEYNMEKEEKDTVIID